MRRLMMAFCLLMIAVRAPAQFHSPGSIVPAVPAAGEFVVYHYMASCSPPREDHKVTITGFDITIREFISHMEGCRPHFISYSVPLGQLAPGTYTLRYYTLDGNLAETITFAVAPVPAIPTVSEVGLAAVAVVLGLCGVALLRR